jgi:FMN phosphatase YigB (HAD superfamily)
MATTAPDFAPIARKPATTRPSFLYFDLGNVLLRFDHRLAARQMAAVAGVSEELVWDTVFASGLELRYEAGEIDDREFHRIFCETTGSRPPLEPLKLAGSDIFTPNTSMFPVVGALIAAGYRLGILSNTSPDHWSFCHGRHFSLLRTGFEAYALSYELGVCKPSPEIYERAAALVGLEPPEVFFVDDIAENVAGARAAGFDAVQYTSTPQLVADLRERGLQFNY